MSNIANQLVAVVATLMGFVAHDALTEHSAPSAVVAAVTNESIDPVVTRAIDFNGISTDWMNTSPRAERAEQLAPAMPASDGTAAVRMNSNGLSAQYATARFNDARFAGNSRTATPGYFR